MSRHRHYRNIRAEDYLDDDYDNHDDYYEEEEPPQQQEAATEPLDETLLEDIVQQFRFVLSDETLTTAQVDEALQQADYDWEVALTALKTRQPETALQASPSPIAALLMNDSPNTYPQTALPMPSANPSPPDYANFVADEGTALNTSPTAANSTVPPPFRFDKPSPDDIVRAKQARVSTRSTSLRLPKPSKPRPSRESDELPPAPDTSAGASVIVAKKARGQVQEAKCVKQRVKKVNLDARLKVATPSIAVIVAGHVDAGKSTLIGHLLELLSTARKKGNKYGKHAWTTDEDAVERERGVTIDIASRLLRRPGNPGRTIALIDAPGHRDFVPAMMQGASQATCALLVVDASPGEFESGFTETAQTREHAIVLKALHVTSLIVVVNKMDVVDFSQKRFDSVCKSVSDFLRSNGWKASQHIRYVPVSGRQGVNLSERAPQKHSLAQWYEGCTLLEELDALPHVSEADVRKASESPTRIVVTDFFKSASLGGQAAVTGRLLSGSVCAKDRLCISPGTTLCTVKSLAFGDGRKLPVAIAGLDAQPLSLGVMDMPDGAVIGCGSVLCDPEVITPAVLRFRATVVITGVNVVVFQGARGVLHVGGAAEAANVCKLVECSSGKKKGTGGKKRVPRRLVKGDTAVIEIQCERAVALEKCDVVKSLARFAFRQDGRTTAVGIVTDIVETEKCSDSNGECSSESTSREQDVNT